MIKEFPPKIGVEGFDSNSGGNHMEKMRRAIGRFGISGKQQTTAMRMMSDGMKSRVVFAHMSFKTPHMFLFDEPTNHLDMETIDSLARAINRWDGGVILVSHDFRLIGQVADCPGGEIWECRDQGVHRWKGDINSFKVYFRDKYAPKEGESLMTENAGKGLNEENTGGAKKAAAPKKKLVTQTKAKKVTSGEEKLSHLTPEARRMAKQLASYGDTLETVTAEAKNLAAAAATTTTSTTSAAASAPSTWDEPSVPSSKFDHLRTKQPEPQPEPEPEPESAPEPEPEPEPEPTKSPEEIAAEEASAAKAARLKKLENSHELANSSFMKKSFKQAIDLYSKAAKLAAEYGDTERQSKLVGNRAECQLRLSKWTEALEDAKLSVSLDATNAKSQARVERAQAELDEIAAASAKATAAKAASELEAEAEAKAEGLMDLCKGEPKTEGAPEPEATTDGAAEPAAESAPAPAPKVMTFGGGEPAKKKKAKPKKKKK